MSSNDEMYSILTPSLSLSPTPTPFLVFFLFLSSLFVLLASCFFKVLSAISSTDQILAVRSIQLRDDPLCRKGKRYITYE